MTTTRKEATMRTREERNAMLEEIYRSGRGSIRNEETGEMLIGEPAVEYFRRSNRIAAAVIEACKRTGGSLEAMQTAREATR